MLICRNCGNSGRDMFGNVCPCQKRRMKGRAMYAVFYRLGGYEETWRQVPDDLIGSYSLAAPIAQTVQAALRHIGYPFAQAEARKLTNADDPRIQPAMSDKTQMAPYEPSRTWSAFGPPAYPEDNAPAAGVSPWPTTTAGHEARHISLGESHKVSVTGMTRCKVCGDKIHPGQTFYFFGMDGPYCAADYANDPRAKAWKF